MMDNLIVFVGLGNPGRQYELTRHNAGFLAIDYFAEKQGININKVKFKGIIGEGKIDDTKVILIKPQTFMNNSGECVREAVDWYKLPLDRLVVIYDDIDIKPGTIRIRASGSAGTHNGMRSVIPSLDSDKFARIRIGIGAPPPQWDLVDYVLGKFPKEEEKLIQTSIEAAYDAMMAIVKSGINTAMNQYNQKRQV